MTASGGANGVSLDQVNPPSGVAATVESKFEVPSAVIMKLDTESRSAVDELVVPKRKVVVPADTFLVSGSVGGVIVVPE